MVRTVANEAFAAGGLIYDRVTKTIVSHFTANGTVWQTTSVDQGATWSKLSNVTRFLGEGFPVPPQGEPNPTVGPGNGLQLSANNKFAPNRLLMAGHHGRYTYDAVYYSDDHAKTWHMAVNELPSQNTLPFSTTTPSRPSDRSPLTYDGYQQTTTDPIC